MAAIKQFTSSEPRLDVTSKIEVSDPDRVRLEVKNILSNRYHGEDLALVDAAFDHFSLTYSGEHDDYHAIDTPYHNIQHVMDVTLATTRLIDGYEQENQNVLGFERAIVGVIVSLFHDSGYLRYSSDSLEVQGAAYTKTHVSRSGVFIEKFLKQNDREDLVKRAIVLVQYTGMEYAIEELVFEDELYLQLGYLIGTADLIAQMADKEYVEKCEEHLYEEFVIGGLTEKRLDDGTIHIVFESAKHLIEKTPEFIRDAIENRLTKSFKKAYQYAAVHFGGRNYYMESIEKNRAMVEKKISTH